MNRITSLFQRKKESSDPEGLLNIYFTAGFPALDDTRSILSALQESGVDLVEIGIPYSDPVADGETIQESNQQALENGMTLKLLLEQLQGMRKEITVPVLLMGYFNPIIQYGVEAFCQAAVAAGIDGVILPDLPLEVYRQEYQQLFDQYGLLNIFLITPQTSEARIREIDAVSEGFIYMVSSASVTGSKTGVSHDMEAYFNRVAAMNLRNSRLVGFGIKDRESFLKASRSGDGAIIGSAFIRVLQNSTHLENDIKTFIYSIKPNKQPVLNV